MTQPPKVAPRADVEALLEEARSPVDAKRRGSAARLAHVRDPRALAALIALLGDARMSVQEAASRALTSRGDAATAEALSHFLGSPDLGLRNRAGSILAGMGEESVPVLVREAGSASAAVRKFVVEVLGQTRSPWAVPSLVQGLRDADVNVAFAAAEALGNFHAPEVAEHLLSVFLERPELRCPVAESLGMQRDDRAVPYLIQALEDPDLLVRFSAANALGLIASPSALRPLMDVFRSCPVPLRHAIIRSVHRVTEHSAALHPGELPALVPDLLGALDSDEWQIRHAALQILAFCPADPRVGDACARRLDDDVEEVRTQAHRNLDRMSGDPVPALIRAAGSGSEVGRTAAVELLVQRPGPRTSSCLCQLVRTAEEPLRVAAILALGQCGSGSDVEALLETAADPSPPVRAAAARALGWLMAEQAASPLWRLLDDESVEVRESAIGALILVGGPDVVGALTEDLRHSRPERRRLAARALGYIGDGSVVAPLIDALAHPDAHIRQSAALSLGRLADCRAFAPLCTLLADADAAVRKGAVDALVALDLVAALPRLAGLLSDPDAWVRYHLVSAVGECALPQVRDLLVNALRDEAPAVSLAAVQALGRLQAPETFESVVATLRRGDPEVVRAAIRVLARWSGEEAREVLERFQADAPEWREEVELASAFR